MAVQTREIQACDGLSESNEFSVAVELSHKKSKCETRMCKPKRIAKRNTQSQHLQLKVVYCPNYNLQKETICWALCLERHAKLPGVSFLMLCCVSQRVHRQAGNRTQGDCCTIQGRTRDDEVQQMRPTPCVFLCNWVDCQDDKMQNRSLLVTLLCPQAIPAGVHISAASVFSSFINLQVHMKEGPYCFCLAKSNRLSASTWGTHGSLCCIYSAVRSGAEVSASWSLPTAGMCSFLLSGSPSSLGLRQREKDCNLKRFVIWAWRPLVYYYRQGGTNKGPACKGRRGPRVPDWTSWQSVNAHIWSTDASSSCSQNWLLPLFHIPFGCTVIPLKCSGFFFFFSGTQLIRVLSFLVTKEDKKQKEQRFESVRTTFPSHSFVLFSQSLLTACDGSSGRCGRTITAATPTQTYQNICSGLLKSPCHTSLERGWPKDVGWREGGFDCWGGRWVAYVWSWTVGSCVIGGSRGRAIILGVETQCV